MLIGGLLQAVPSATRTSGTLLPDNGETFSIGGCRAYSPRASYTAFSGNPALACDGLTPSRLCGGDLKAVRFSSGMGLPRHNVYQYTGNAVWDGLARDGFSRLVAAMLGDPFAFVVAPEMDALRRLLQEPTLTSQQLAAQMRTAWSIDPRYEGAPNSNGTWTNFMNAISGEHGGAAGGGLTRDFVLHSAAFQALKADAVVTRITDALNGGTTLSPEGAMCAAMYLVDAMFDQRGHSAALNDLPSAFADMANLTQAAGASGVPTLFEELYDTTLSVLPSNVRDDPHNVIYTSPYQYNANGWYGGNLTITFTPTSEGSGIDTKWAVYRGCPMPGGEAAFCAERQRRLDRSTRTPACDTAAQDCGAQGPRVGLTSVDQGEMRTPNYKAPHEVLGLSAFPWNDEPRCALHEPGYLPCRQQHAVLTHRSGEDGGDMASADDFATLAYDMTTLQRPHTWSIQRTRGMLEGSTSMAYLLAPVALEEPKVYGIDYTPAADPTATAVFTASPPPPHAWGVDELIEAENYRAPDLPPTTERVVPVWGMLYPCARTNLPNVYLTQPTTSGATAAPDPELCAAYRAMAPHRNMSRAGPLYATMSTLRLPAEWERELRTMRVWEPSATVDLGAPNGARGATAPAGGTRRDVCVLSFASFMQMTAC